MSKIRKNSEASPENKEDSSSQKPSDVQSSLNFENVMSAIEKKQEKGIPTCKIGLPPGWRKSTFVVRDDHYEKLKEMSYWERIPIKDILEQVLERFLSSRKNYPRIQEKRDILQPPDHTIDP